MSQQTLKARRAYKTTGDEFVKNLLEDIFSKEILTQDIRQLVTSFESACLLMGENPLNERYTTGDAYEVALRRCRLIAAALKEGVKMSYKNTNQKKWYAVIQYVEGEGFRFWFAGHGYAGAAAPGGAALCFPTKELAEYFGKTFLNEIIPIIENDKDI